jgi:hypothetical protein
MKFYEIKYGIKGIFKKLFRGYSDNEWWNFYAELSKWAIPRLKTLKEKVRGVPCEFVEGEEFTAISLEQWQETIQTMINAFQHIIDGEDYKEEDVKTIEEGLNNFRKYFQNLWD